MKSDNEVVVKEYQHMITRVFLSTSGSKTFYFQAIGLNDHELRLSGR